MPYFFTIGSLIKWPISKQVKPGLSASPSTPITIAITNSAIGPIV